MNQSNQKSPRPYQGNRPTNRVAVPPANGQASPKRPTYLTEVRAELLKIIIEGYATSKTEADEITDRLWHFLGPKLAESYWNGVEAGASGRVKPRPDQPRQGKTYRLTGGTQDRAISNGNSWSESEVPDERG